MRAVRQLELVVGIVGCGVAMLAAGQPAPEAAQAPLEAKLAELRSELPAPAREPVEGFYAARQHRPLWVDNGGVRPAARQLVDFIRDVAQEGLDPDDYGPEALRTRLEQDPDGPDERLALELELTRTFVELGGHLARGRVHPDALDVRWHIDPEPVDYQDALEQASREGPAAALRALAPRNPGYQSLRTQLQRYLERAANGGFTRVPEGGVLAEGESGDPERVAALRVRLAEEGYLPEKRRSLLDRARALLGRSSPEPDAAKAAVYDARLARAVREFQDDRGIEEDGVLGPNTLRELNVPAAERARTIALNMERWRWVPISDEGEQILVNVPSFEMSVRRGGRDALQMAVVVGRPDWSTPIFHDRLTSIVINPYWNVPESIAVDEILPQVVQQGPSYLEQRNFEVLEGWGDAEQVVDPHSIDWASVDPAEFPYRFRQGSGEGNALGRIKFLFPNDFNVYLHDTPSDHLFSRTDRAFSHGCIRVERPVELAETLLAGTQWSRAKIEETIESGERTWIDVDEPIPVSILYWTAFQNHAGRMEFHQDVYEVDAVVARALKGHLPTPKDVADASWAESR